MNVFKLCLAALVFGLGCVGNEAVASDYSSITLGDRVYNLSVADFEPSLLTDLANSDDEVLPADRLNDFVVIGDDLYFSITDWGGSVPYPLLRVYKAGDQWRGQVVSVQVGDLETFGSSSAKIYIGVDSTGAPYIYTLATCKKTNGVYGPNRPIVLFPIELSDGELVATASYHLVCDDGYLNRTIAVDGSAASGTFKANGILWKTQKADYTSDDCYLQRQYMGHWTVTDGVASFSLISENVSSTVTSLQGLGNGTVLTDDNGTIPLPGFSSDGREGYLPQAPSLAQVNDGVLTTLSTLPGTEGVHDTGAKIFYLGDEPCIFYTSSTNPTTYTIARLNVTEEGQPDLTSAEPLYTLNENFPPQQSLTSTTAGIDELNNTRSQVVTNPNRADLYFTTNGTGVSHYVLTAADNTSTGLETVVVDSQTPTYYHLNGQRADGTLHGLVIRVDGNESRIVWMR